MNFRICNSYANLLLQSRMPFEKATLAFMILAIIFQFACVGLFVLLFMSPNMNMAGAAAGAAFLSFVCLFCTVIIFGTQFQHKISESVYEAKLSFGKRMRLRGKKT